jgi:hypothetical protein
MKKKYDKGLALGTGKSTIENVHAEISAKLIETHEEVAARIFNVPVTEVTPEQRMFVKRARFWSLYSAPFHARYKNRCSVSTKKSEEKFVGCQGEFFYDEI